MGISVNNFEIIILPGKNPPEEYISYYNRAYECWKETWQLAYAHEMNHQALLTSDSFTRQDEVLALFYNSECVGLAFFRNVDFYYAASADDSYFEHWPKSCLAELCKHGQKILVISQFTINPHYRKDFHGVSLRDLLIGLCYERFLYSDCDAGATAVRIQKNMHKAVSNVGASVLAGDMPYSFDQRVDLVAYYRDQIHASNVPGIKELVAQIFPKITSLVHPIEPIKKGDKRAA